MCYSAQLKEEWRTFLRHGGRLGLKEFADVYGARIVSSVKIPKMLDTWFDDIDSHEAAEIRAAIAEHKKTQGAKWELELFKQRRRKADAERKLNAGKVTKKAQEDLRISTEKVNQLQGWVEDLKRTERQTRDARIYPNSYAPVMIWQDAGPVILPMRYMMRPTGMPASIDRLGTLYNARRDNLEKFWRKDFGHHHGLMLATAFYEHVEREGQDVVLKFEPSTGQDMLVACLWSRWVGRDGEELYSFAAITDEPPPEVAAAGHDRCIIPIREENIESWLRPEGNLQKSYAVLDDRERPHYEHRMAA